MVEPNWTLFFSRRESTGGVPKRWRWTHDGDEEAGLTQAQAQAQAQAEATLSQEEWLAQRMDDFGSAPPEKRDCGWLWRLIRASRTPFEAGQQDHVQYAMDTAGRLKQPPGPCTVQWAAGTRAYRCLTCQTTSVMALCEACFHRSRHHAENHETIMYKSTDRGSCDCGTEEAMDCHFFCSAHGAEPNVELHDLPGDPVVRRVLGVAQGCFRLLAKVGRVGLACNKLLYAVWLAPTLNTRGVDWSAVWDVLAFLHELSKETLFRRCVCYAATLVDCPLAEVHMDCWLVLAAMNDGFPDELMALLTALLLNRKFKARAMVYYVNHYPILPKSFLHASTLGTESGPLRHSHRMFSVQLISGVGPDLEKILPDGRVLVEITKALKQVLTEAARPDPGLTSRLLVYHHHSIVQGKYYLSIANDLIDLLEDGKQVDKLLQTPEALGYLLDCFALLEHTFPVNRQRAVHVVRDEPWAHCWKAVEACCHSIIGRLNSWLNGCDVETGLRLTQSLIAPCLERLTPLLDSPPIREQYSLFLPLHRLLGLAITFLSSAGKASQLDSLLGPDPRRLSKLAQRPLKLVACRAQIRAGLWVRNGLLVQHQMYAYAVQRDAFLVADLDVFWLQLGLSHPESRKWLLRESLQQFNLADFLDSDSLGSIEDPSLLHALFGLLEDWVLLMIQALYDRSHMERWSLRQRVQREVVVDLMRTQPVPHSVLTRRTPTEVMENHPGVVDEVLAEVADFVPASAHGSQGSYRIKPAAVAQFNPAHLAMRTLERGALVNALEAQRAVQTANGLDAAVFPTAMPPVPAAHSGVLDVLRSPELHFALAHGLRVATFALDKHCYSSLATAGMLQLLFLCLTDRDGAARPLRDDAASGDEDSEGAGFSSPDVLVNAVLPIVADASQSDPPATLVGMLLLLRGHKDASNDQALLTRILRLLERSPTAAALINAGSSAAATDEQSSEGGAPSLSVEEESDKRRAKRRRIARARRERLMSKVRTQQANFLATTADAMDAKADDGAQSAVAAAAGSGDAAGAASYECVACFQPCRLGEEGSLLIGRRVTPYAVSSSAPIGGMLRSCGHWIHAECHKSFMEANRNRADMFEEGQRQVTAMRGEFLCPMCRTFSTTVIPSTWSPNSGAARATGDEASPPLAAQPAQPAAEPAQHVQPVDEDGDVVLAAEAATPPPPIPVAVAAEAISDVDLELAGKLVEGSSMSSADAWRVFLAQPLFASAQPSAEQECMAIRNTLLWGMGGGGGPAGAPLKVLPELQASLLAWTGAGCQSPQSPAALIPNMLREPIHLLLAELWRMPSDAGDPWAALSQSDAAKSALLCAMTQAAIKFVMEHARAQRAADGTAVRFQARETSELSELRPMTEFVTIPEDAPYRAVALARQGNDPSLEPTIAIVGTGDDHLADLVLPEAITWRHTEARIVVGATPVALQLYDDTDQWLCVEVHPLPQPASLSPAALESTNALRQLCGMALAFPTNVKRPAVSDALWQSLCEDPGFRGSMTRAAREMLCCLALIKAALRGEATVPAATDLDGLTAFLDSASWRDLTQGFASLAMPDAGVPSWDGRGDVDALPEQLYVSLAVARLVTWHGVGLVMSLGELSRPRFSDSGLIDLPEEYDQLVQAHAADKCSACKCELSEPNICLTCGCSFCDQDITWHCLESCRGGLFISLGTSDTRFMAARLGSLRFQVGSWGSLYLDAHGEEDLGLERGRRLWLHAARLERLKQDWRAQRLDTCMRRWWVDDTSYFPMGFTV